MVSFILPVIPVFCITYLKGQCHDFFTLFYRVLLYVILCNVRKVKKKTFSWIKIFFYHFQKNYFNLYQYQYPVLIVLTYDTSDMILVFVNV